MLETLDFSLFWRNISLRCWFIIGVKHIIHISRYDYIQILVLISTKNDCWQKLLAARRTVLKRIFFITHFIHITKNDSLSWQTWNKEILIFPHEWLVSRGEVRFSIRWEELGLSNSLQNLNFSISSWIWNKFQSEKWLEYLWCYSRSFHIYRVN